MCSADADAPALRVVAGMLMADGRVLMARPAAGHPLAGWWEFPGGKIEPSESPQQALARELHEELGVRVAVGPFVAETAHANGGRRILLEAYLATLRAGRPVARQHAAVAWFAPDTLDPAIVAPGDRPLLAALRRLRP